MGRHTASIPIVPAGSRPAGPVTDPRLLDPRPSAERPRPPIADRSPVPERQPVADALSAPAPAAPLAPDLDDDGLDERVVDVPPITARSVLEAEAEAGSEAEAEAETPAEPPRSEGSGLRDIVFAGVSVAILAVVVAVATAPR